MKKINVLKTIIVATGCAVATNANAQVALTKTLPPIGTTYEWRTNLNLDPATVVPDTGANVTWDYSSITTTKTYDLKIQALSAVPAAEQTFASAAGAVYAEEILAFPNNPDWNQRDYYKDNGDYLIKVAEKGMTTSPIQSASDTIFKFNVAYQSTVNFNPSDHPASYPLKYDGYGTLTIGGDTYNDVVLFVEDVTVTNDNDTLYYFYTVTPHYHRLARLRFSNGQRQILFYKPTGTTPTTPAAPSNLVSAPGKTASATVLLTWADNANNETGFKVERSTDGTNFTEIADLGVDVQTYHDLATTENTAYHYRVLAYNAQGNSAFSNVAQITTGTTTGISDVTDELPVVIYPNPANNFVTIGNLALNSKLRIADVTGRFVYNSVTTNSNETISTENFENGIYFIQVESNSKVSVKKLVVRTSN